MYSMSRKVYFMDISNSYVQLKAEILSANNKNPNEIFLFNSSTNRGFMVDGIAAVLCKRMSGEKKINELISDFEKEYEVECNKFANDISQFLKNLVENDLILISDNPIEVKK
jgi:hypothetical protein